MGEHDGVELVERPLVGDAVVIFDFARPLKKAEVNEDICLLGLYEIRRPVTSPPPAP
jgi:hypothetical protein